MTTLGGRTHDAEEADLREANVLEGCKRPGARRGTGRLTSVRTAGGTTCHRKKEADVGYEECRLLSVLSTVPHQPLSGGQSHPCFHRPSRVGALSAEGSAPALPLQFPRLALCPSLPRPAPAPLCRRSLGEGWQALG